MNYFKNIKVEDKKYIEFFILLTYESPFKYLNEINTYLKDNMSKGYIIIDTFLHSGKSKDRYIELYWNGADIDKTSIQYVTIKHKKYAKSTCEFLRNNIEILNDTILNEYQISLIHKGITL